MSCTENVKRVVSVGMRSLEESHPFLGPEAYEARVIGLVRSQDGSLYDFDIHMNYNGCPTLWWSDKRRYLVYGRLFLP